MATNENTVVARVKIVSDADDVLQTFKEFKRKGSDAFTKLKDGFESIFKEGKSLKLFDGTTPQFKRAFDNIRDYKKELANTEKAHNLPANFLNAEKQKAEEIRGLVDQLAKSFSKISATDAGSYFSRNKGDLELLREQIKLQVRLGKITAAQGAKLNNAVTATQEKRPDVGDDKSLNKTGRSANTNAKDVIKGLSQQGKAVQGVSDLVRKLTALFAEEGKVSKSNITQAIALREAEITSNKSLLTMNNRLLDVEKARQKFAGVNKVVKAVVGNKSIDAAKELELRKRLLKVKDLDALNDKQRTILGQKILTQLNAESAVTKRNLLLKKEISAEAKKASNIAKTEGKSKAVSDNARLLTSVTLLAAQTDALGISETQLAAAVKRTAKELANSGNTLADNKKLSQERLQSIIAETKSLNELGTSAKRADDLRRATLTTAVFQGNTNLRTSADVELAKKSADIAIAEGKGIAYASTVAKELLVTRRETARLTDAAQVATLKQQNAETVSILSNLRKTKSFKDNLLSTEVDLNKVLAQTTKEIQKNNVPLQKQEQLFKSNLAAARALTSVQKEVGDGQAISGARDDAKRTRLQAEYVKVLTRHAKANNNLGATENQLKRAVEATARSLASQNIALSKGSRLAKDSVRSNLELAKAQDKLGLSRKSSSLGSLGVLALVSRSVHSLISVIRNASQRFAEFELSMTEVRKTANASAEDMKELSKEVVKLGQSVKLPVSDLAKIAGVLGQVGQLSGGGIDQAAAFADNAREAIKLVGQVAIATDLAAEDAAKSFGQLTAIFSKDIKNINTALLGLQGGVANATTAMRVMFGVMNELSNSSVATVANLNQFIENFGGVAAQAGLTHAQVSALGATIADLGISSKVAGTALSRIFADMSKKSDIFADAIGTSKEAFESLFLTDPNTAMLDFFDALHNSSNRRVNDIKNQLKLEQRASNTLLKLSAGTEIYRKHLVTANNAQAAFNSIQSEADKFAQTYQASIDGVSNSFTGLLNSLQPLFGIFGSMLDALSGLVTGITTLLDASPLLATISSYFIAIGASLLVAAGAATILTSSFRFLGVVDKFTALKGIITKFTAGLGSAKVSSDVLTVATGRLSGALRVQNASMGSSIISLTNMNRATKTAVIQTDRLKKNVGTLNALGKGALLGTAAIGGMALASGDLVTSMLLLAPLVPALLTGFVKLGKVGFGTALIRGAGTVVASLGAVITGIGATVAAAAGAGAAVVGAGVVLVKTYGKTVEDIAARTVKGTDDIFDSAAISAIRFRAYLEGFWESDGLFLDNNLATNQLKDFNKELDNLNRIMSGKGITLFAQTNTVASFGSSIGVAAKKVQELNEAINAGTLTYGAVIQAFGDYAEGNKDAVDNLSKAVAIAKKLNLGALKLDIDFGGVDEADRKQAFKDLDTYISKLAPAWRKALKDANDTLPAEQRKFANEEIDKLSTDDLVRTLALAKKSGKLDIELPITLKADSDTKLQVDANSISDILNSSAFTKAIALQETYIDNLKNIRDSQDKLTEVQGVTKGNVNTFDFSKVTGLKERVAAIKQAQEIGESADKETQSKALDAYTKVNKDIEKERQLITRKGNGELAQDLQIQLAQLDRKQREVDTERRKSITASNNAELAREIKREELLALTERKLALETSRIKLSRQDNLLGLDANLIVELEANVNIDPAQLNRERARFDTLTEESSLKSKLLNIEEEIIKLSQENTDSARARISVLKEEGRVAEIISKTKIAAIKTDSIAALKDSVRVQAASNLEKIQESVSKKSVLEAGRRDNLVKSAQDEIKIQSDKLNLIKQEEGIRKRINTILEKGKTINFGAGINVFTEAMRSARDNARNLLVDITKLGENSKLDGVAAAYKSIALAAKDAAFQAGTVVDKRAALEEAIRSDSGSERARAAEELFKRIDKISSSKLDDNVKALEKGKLISRFQRRASDAGLKGEGASIAQIVQLATLKAKSENNNIQTSAGLEAEFLRQFEESAKKIPITDDPSLLINKSLVATNVQLVSATSNAATSAQSFSKVLNTLSAQVANLNAIDVTNITSKDLGTAVGKSNENVSKSIEQASTSISGFSGVIKKVFSNLTTEIGGIVQETRKDMFHFKNDMKRAGR